MPINKGLGGFCFLKSVKDESLPKNRKSSNNFHATFI